MTDYWELYEWPTVRCDHCQYWQEGLPNTGQCKRRAPDGNGFAMTSADNWCGDFAKRQERFFRT